MSTIEHDLAKKIVDKLFTNDLGERYNDLFCKRTHGSVEAFRVLLTREAAIERVKEVLERELKR